MPTVQQLLLYFLFILQLATSTPLSKRDADFDSVKTRLEQSHQKIDPTKPNKYFHECAFHEHYDGRFADKPLDYDARQLHLRALVQTYLATMNDIGIETFIMHGTLLGWYWNRQVLPWDSDIDVMVTEKSIHHLASYYNMTVHHLLIPGTEDEKRSYLLEVNPHYANNTLDPDNKIDARWIDTDSGLFIDITTLRVNTAAQAAGLEGALMVKDKHHYLSADIFPLRETTFEGFPARVPFKYTEVLVEEYGRSSLTNVYFASHRFDPSVGKWMPLRWADPLQRPVIGTSSWGRGGARPIEFGSKN